AAAILFTPVSLVAGSWFGSMGGSLLGAALPAISTVILLPALAVTAATWIAGELLQPGRYGFVAPGLITIGVNTLVTVAAALLGLSGVNFMGGLIFTLVEMVLLPPTAVGTMHWLAPSEVPARTTA